MYNKKDFITTIGGKSISPLSPAAEDIDINDIAHALSLICRANGHLREFFSVARHCINCAKEAESRGYSVRVQLFCLLHDAAEAYIGDMTRPLKRRLEYYCKCEEKLHADILTALGIGQPDSDELKKVRRVDDCMLYHEFRIFNGECLFDEAPYIHIEIEHSERKFAETKAEYLEIYQKLCAEVTEG